MVLEAIFGFDEVASQLRWSQYEFWRERVGGLEGVPQGMVVTPGAGRTVSITRGLWVMPGLLGQSTATETFTLGTATTQLLCVQATWASQEVIFRAITPAQKVQTPGVQWMLPFAQVVIAAGAPATSATITRVAPLPQKAIRFAPSFGSEVSLVPNGGVRNLVSFQVPDPGWPYRLASLSTAQVVGDSGKVYIEGVAGTAGTRLAIGRSTNLGEGSESPVPVSGVAADVFAGSTTVTFRAAQYDAVANAGASVMAVSYFHVLQIPA